MLLGIRQIKRHCRTHAKHNNLRPRLIIYQPLALCRLMTKAALSVTRLARNVFTGGTALTILYVVPLVVCVCALCVCTRAYVCV